MAETSCEDSFTDYVGVARTYSRYAAAYLAADAAAWANPALRTVTCLVGSADGGLVGSARKALEGIVDDDPAAGPLAARVSEAGYLLSDAAGELASYLAGLDADPGRLEWIAGRLAALAGLTRRYGESVDEVLSIGQKILVQITKVDDRGKLSLAPVLEEDAAEAEAPAADAATEEAAAE